MHNCGRAVSSEDGQYEVEKLTTVSQAIVWQRARRGVRDVSFKAKSREARPAGPSIQILTSWWLKIQLFVQLESEY